MRARAHKTELILREMSHLSYGRKVQAVGEKGRRAESQPRQHSMERGGKVSEPV